MDVMISRIYKDSLAEEFGLKKFDQIIDIDGIKPSSTEEAIRLIKNSDKTKPLKLEIIRDRRKTIISINWKKENNKLGVDFVWGEDNSKKIKYYCILIDKDGKKVKRNIYSEDEEVLKNRVESKGYRFVSIIKKELPSGKFSCLRCGSRYGSCKVDSNLFLLVMLLFSWIVALLTRSSLPKTCECFICGYKWET